MTPLNNLSISVVLTTFMLMGNVSAYASVPTFPTTQYNSSGITELQNLTIGSPSSNTDRDSLSETDRAIQEKLEQKDDDLIEQAKQAFLNDECMDVLDLMRLMPNSDPLIGKMAMEIEKC